MFQLIWLWIFIGHNWGSEHDPDTDSCAPSSSSGGRFIMYPSAVSGYGEKNPNEVSQGKCSTTQSWHHEL